MKRSPNDFNENTTRDNDNKRQRSLSASFVDHQQANSDWLLANQQRMHLQAQSEALAAVAAAGGHHLGLEESSNRGGQHQDGLAVAQPSRIAAFEHAQNQLAAAMIRQRQAEDALRQCQQQQAAAVAEFLQQQAAAANIQQGGVGVGNHQGQLATNQSSTKPPVPQGFADSMIQGNFDRPMFNNQGVSALSRNPEGISRSNDAAVTGFGSAGMDFSNNAHSIVPGYSSMLLSSPPVPLNSHLLPVHPTGIAMPNKKQEASSSPKPAKKAKKSSNSTNSPKVSIAGPKRRPVSLQSLVNRGEACYDPGPVRELALPSDRGNLSEYQCLLRKQIVLFSVSINDIQCSAQGRNKPIVIGQVGVLCRHCARIPPGMRPCGAAYFPGKLSGLYQAAQNMAINHLTKSCRSIADDTKDTLIKLKAQKSTVLGGGKNFWANGAKLLGVVEVEEGHLRFQDGK